MAEVDDKLEQHPIATLFPAPSKAEINAIKLSVFKSNGVSSKNPVVIFDGKVLEKWHEYSTCAEFGLSCATVEYTGSAEDMIKRLLNNNTFQLSKEQRALIAAHLKKIYRTTARENQSAAGTGKISIEKFHSRKAAADIMKISPRMVSNAESIIDSGCEELVSFVIEGVLSISRAADIARLEPEKQAKFIDSFNTKIEDILTWLNPLWVEKEERFLEKYEEEMRYIKSIYKDKRQVLNLDLQKRITLADTTEEEEQLGQERSQARKDLAEYQKVNLEKAKLKYEKERAANQNKWNSFLQKMKKKHLTELVLDALDKDKEYLVYMRWDYELGEVELRAAYGKIKFFDAKAEIYTLNSGRKVLNETESISLVHTADVAKEICEKINKQKFCRTHRIFKPNSWQQRIYNKIGKDFLEKVQRLI